MQRKLILTAALVTVLALVAAPVFAQEHGAGADKVKNANQWLLISAGFGMAIAAAGCGYAQSRALTGACEGVSRNPGTTDTIRIFTFLGLAFIEFLALLTFVVVLLMMYG